LAQTDNKLCKLFKFDRFFHVKNENDVYQKILFEFLLDINCSCQIRKENPFPFKIYIHILYMRQSNLRMKLDQILKLDDIDQHYLQITQLDTFTCSIWVNVENHLSFCPLNSIIDFLLSYPKYPHSIFWLPSWWKNFHFDAHNSYINIDKRVTFNLSWVGRTSKWQNWNVDDVDDVDEESNVISLLSRQVMFVVSTQSYASYANLIFHWKVSI
jgi:hypothetical protein